MTSKGYIIIDPPVGPFSTVAELEGWLKYLEKLPADNEQVQEATKEAEGWLEEAKARGAEE